MPNDFGDGRKRAAEVFYNRRQLRSLNVGVLVPPAKRTTVLVRAVECIVQLNGRPSGHSSQNAFAVANERAAVVEFDSDSVLVQPRQTVPYASACMPGHYVERYELIYGSVLADDEMRGRLCTFIA